MTINHRFLFPLLTCFLFFGCAKKQPASSGGAVDSSQTSQVAQANTVAEVIDAGNYTYVRVETGEDDTWLAVPHTEVAVGDIVVLPQDMMPMENWHSKTLDRTFELVYFAGGIGTVGIQEPTPPKATPSTEEDLQALDFTGITTPEGGKTVADLYAQKESLKGRNVLLRAIVVKVNRNIMGKNWVHVRDGTGTAETNDLAITTQDLPKVGDTVLIKGDLHTEVDFGAGYSFSVIIEEGSITVE